MKKILLFILLSIFIKNRSNADCNGRYLNSIFDSAVVQKDVVFGGNKTSSGVWQDLKMDVWSGFNDSETNRPLIVWIHGGSFSGGDKDTYEGFLPCIAFAKKGYVCANINYRVEASILSLLSAESMIKAVMRAVEDSKAAVRFFKKDAKLNGNIYGVDTNQIYIGGASAGAITALHHAYLDDSLELEVPYRKYLKDIGLLHSDGNLEGNSGNSGYSSKVKAVLNVSGALRDVNYMNNNKNIPVFSCHNNIDFTIPYGTFYPYFLPILPTVSGSQIITQKANQLSIYNDLYTVNGIGHVPFKNNNGAVHPIFDSMMNKMTRFLYKTLDCNPNHIILKTNQSMAEDAFSIYPNPTTDFLIVKQKNNLGANKIKFIQLVNLIGQTEQHIQFEQQNSDETSVKVQQLPNGIYWLVLLNEQGENIGTYKFVKN